MDSLKVFTIGFLEVFAILVTVGLLCLLIAIAYMYVVDVRQKRHAVLRNYPVIGRFRYIFEHMGEFFRQYFFALDREEMPFNRAQRSWVYRSAKNIDSTVAFGSTMPLNQQGSLIFLNGLFPPVDEECKKTSEIIYGEGYARHPYTTDKFFNISAMSFGALSAPAVEALSRGARDAGIWLNTGEGGLSPHHLSAKCDIVFQIGTAKYGVRDENGDLDKSKLKDIGENPNVKMIEIKLSQGAKPGKGGILPANKVTDVIASTRGIPKGEASISPNRHKDIGSLGELLDFIHMARELTGKPVGFKAVMGETTWVDEFCELVNERGMEYAPDFITLDSGDGGTGAAPQSLIDCVGQPIHYSLPFLVDKLIEHSLRNRIRVICSGKMINPPGVAAALCAGADSVNSARGFMFALGCIQALQCNKNTCPTGITTHDEDLQHGLDPTDKGNRVANYARNMHKEVEIIAHSCGISEPREFARKHLHVVDEDTMEVPVAPRTK